MSLKGMHFLHFAVIAVSVSYIGCLPPESASYTLHRSQTEGCLVAARAISACTEPNSPAMGRGNASDENDRLVQPADKSDGIVTVNTCSFPTRFPRPVDGSWIWLRETIECFSMRIRELISDVISN